MINCLICKMLGGIKYQLNFFKNNNLNFFKFAAKRKKKFLKKLSKPYQPLKNHPKILRQNAKKPSKLYYYKKSFKNFAIKRKNNSQKKNFLAALDFACSL